MNIEIKGRRPEYELSSGDLSFALRDVRQIEDELVSKALAKYAKMRRKNGFFFTSEAVTNLLEPIPENRRMEAIELMYLMGDLYSLGEIASPPEEIVLTVKEEGRKRFLEAAEAKRKALP